MRHWAKDELLHAFPIRKKHSRSLPSSPCQVHNLMQLSSSPMIPDLTIRSKVLFASTLIPDLAFLHIKALKVLMLALPEPAPSPPSPSTNQDRKVKDGEGPTGQLEWAQAAQVEDGDRWGSSWRWWGGGGTRGRGARSPFEWLVRFLGRPPPCCLLPSMWFLIPS